MTVDRLKAALAISLRRHLAGGKPIVPEAGVLLWNLFMEIGASRTYHAAGPHPISFAEIEAYARLHRWPLQSHHVEIIRTLDEIWLERTYSQRDGEKQKATHRAHARPLTASAFDAVFG